MSASVREHQYAAGSFFYTVECDECLTILNSGHHYPPGQRPFADALAEAHNAEHHADPVPESDEPKRCAICDQTGLLWRKGDQDGWGEWFCPTHMFGDAVENERRHGSRTADAGRMISVLDVERVMAETMRARSPESALGELHGRLRALLPDDAAKRLRDLFAVAIDAWYGGPVEG